MAQLILGVNDALNGCPVEPTPTDQPGRPPRRSRPGSGGNCTLDRGPNQSHLELYLAVSANPVTLPLAGSIDVACDVAGGRVTGRPAPARSPRSIPSASPASAPSASPRRPSRARRARGRVRRRRPARRRAALERQRRQPATATTPAWPSARLACTGSGAMASLSGCTGFCSLANDVQCSVDADCLPDKGACNGPDPVGAHAGICQCSCINPAAGAAAVAGDLQCPLGAHLTVECNPPCDGGDVVIDLGDSCVTQTTATTSTLMTNANFGVGSPCPPAALRPRAPARRSVLGAHRRLSAASSCAARSTSSARRSATSPACSQPTASRHLYRRRAPGVCRGAPLGFSGSLW